MLIAEADREVTDALVLPLEAADAWRKKAEKAELRTKRCLRALRKGNETWHQTLEARFVGGERRRRGRREKG